MFSLGEKKLRKSIGQYKVWHVATKQSNWSIEKQIETNKQNTIHRAFYLPTVLWNTIF